MDYNSKTDLEVARDLELLCQKVNEALEKASKFLQKAQQIDEVLQKAQQIDEVSELIRRIEIVSQDLELNKQLLQKTKTDLDETLSELESFKNLPQRLDQLGILDQSGIKENVLQDIQRILDEVRQAKTFSEQTLAEQQTNQEKIEQNKNFIQQTEADIQLKLQELQRIIIELEYFKNLSQRLDQLGMRENVLQDMQSILGEVRQAKTFSEQTITELQTNHERIEQNKNFIQQTEADIQLKLQELQRIIIELEYFKNLPQRLDQLGIRENVLQDMQRILEEIQQAKAFSEQTIADLQTNQERIEQNKNFIQQTEADTQLKLQELQKIIAELEHFKNLPQRLDQLGIRENVLQDMQRILEEVQQAKAFSEQTLTNLQINQERIEQNKNFIQQTEADTQLKLQELQKITSELEHFKNLPQRLDQLGIRENVLQDMQRILEEIQQAKAFSEQTITELNTKQEKIEQVKNFIQQTEANTQKLLDQVQKIVSELEPIRNIPKKLNELGITDNIIEKTNELLDESRFLRNQLEVCKQEMIAIRQFESYLREFRRQRTSKQLRTFLYQELGFAGLIIYVLHLISPRRRNS